MNETILITGASGFIGKHLLRQLIKNNYVTVCLDLVFGQEFINEFIGKTTIVEGNITNEIFIKDLIDHYSPNYIFHFAGAKGRTNRISEFHESFAINYNGTLNLFTALLKKRNLKKIVILGTIEEYGNAISPFHEELKEMPSSAYGLSKLSATKLALIFNQHFKLPITVLRPSIIYGPGQALDMFMPALIVALINNQEFKMTAGEQLRDFIFIDDLIGALILTKDLHSVNGQVINIGAGESIQLCTLASIISQMIGKSDLLKVGALPYRTFEIMRYEVNNEKAKRLLNWSPKYDIKHGLRETVQFYKEN